MAAGVSGLLIPRVVLWSLKVQPSTVVKDVGETVVTAHLPGRSGVCNLPTSFSNSMLQGVPSACLVLCIHIVLRGMSLTRHLRRSCVVVPPGLTGRRRFSSAPITVVWRRAGTFVFIDIVLYV